MPGPDSIPHGAGSAPVAARALYDIDRCFFNGNIESLPPDMRHCLMVVLPKGSDVRDNGPTVSRGPKETRPLSMSNTDIKIPAGAMSILLAEHISMIVSTDQK
eukprot:9151438-Pyramimonas_sp.AAC.1